MLLQRQQGNPLARTRSSGGARQPHPLGAVTVKLQSGQSQLVSTSIINNETQTSPSTSRLVLCHSSHTHAARLSEESKQFDTGLILVFKRWTKTLSLLGVLAAWTYLSLGNTNSLFASVSLSMPSTSGAGEVQSRLHWAPVILADDRQLEQVRRKSQPRVVGRDS